MTATAPNLASPRPSSAPIVEGTSGSTEERARAEARQLWADLAHARGASGTIGSPGTAPAEDAVFRFYLPLAHALGDGAVCRTVDTESARHAAELGLAQAVLSWPGSDDGFMHFASRCITTVLRHLRTAPTGRPPALHPMFFPPRSPGPVLSRPRGATPTGAPTAAS